MGDLGSIPGLERSPGEGNGNPLQDSCQENPVDRGAWQGTVHGVAKSWTQLSDFTFTFNRRMILCPKVRKIIFQLLSFNTVVKVSVLNIIKYCLTEISTVLQSYLFCPTVTLRGFSRLLSGKRIHRPVQELLGEPVRSLSRADPLEEEVATHSSILAWRIL